MGRCTKPAVLRQELRGWIIIVSWGRRRGVLFYIHVFRFAEWGEGVDSDVHPGSEWAHFICSRFSGLEQVQVEGGQIVRMQALIMNNTR